MFPGTFFFLLPVNSMSSFEKNWRNSLPLYAKSVFKAFLTSCSGFSRLGWFGSRGLRGITAPFRTTTVKRVLQWSKSSPFCWWNVWPSSCKIRPHLWSTIKWSAVQRDTPVLALTPPRLSDTGQHEPKRSLRSGLKLLFTFSRNTSDVERQSLGRFVLVLITFKDGFSTVV